MTGRQKNAGLAILYLVGICLLLAVVGSFVLNLPAGRAR